MNMRRACMLGVFSVLMAVLSAGNLMAQRFGVRAGIAPAFRVPVVTPGFVQPLTVPFGMASSTFGFPGIQTPFIVNSGGFGVNLGLGGGLFGCCAVQASRVIVPGQVFVPGQIVVPGAIGPGQIIVPGQALFPGFVPGQILVPGQRAFRLQTVFPQSRGLPRPGFVPGTIVTGVPLGFAGVPVTGLPPIGTSREQVVSQFGLPTVSIVTSTGETLHFTGGVTVFIQNGQVASPR